MTSRGADANKRAPKPEISKPSKAQRDVGAFGNQVVRPIGDEQLDVEVRVLLQERRQARDHFASPEPAGHHDAQRAMETIHPARRVGRLIEIGKDAPRPIEEHRAGVGRRDAARRPEQQLHPEPILELATIRETEGCDRPNSRATSEKLPVSAARTKTESS